jgi:hypothetical protein
MKKAIVAMVVLGLLPITSAPANAGVSSCRYTQVKHLDPNGKRTGYQYTYKHICTHKTYKRR